MKLTLDLEIDWIDEDMSIDDAVKQEIINSITSRIQTKIEEKTLQKVEQSIDRVTSERINAKVDEIFNDFINRPVSLSDNYGEVINQFDSMEDLIKFRFDKFLTQTVDEKGKAYDGSYGKKYQRLEFIINKQLKTFADQFTTDAVKQVSEEIQKHVKDGLTNKLGSELMKVLKVEQMLKIE